MKIIINMFEIVRGKKIVLNIKCFLKAKHK